MTPDAHSHVVGHLWAVHSGYGAYQLVGHSADRSQIMLHGQIHIACAHKASIAAIVAARTSGERGHSHILRPERCAATCPEVTEHTSTLHKTSPLGFSTLSELCIIKSVGISGHDIIQLRNHCEHLYFKQNGAAPAPLESYVEVSFVVLKYADLTRIVSETFQVTVKPVGNIAAPTLHEVDLLVGYDHRFQSLDLSTQFVGKPSRIHRVVAVVEAIFHLCARKIVYHSHTHCEFIQIVVCEMGDYLLHGLYFCS